MAQHTSETGAEVASVTPAESSPETFGERLVRAGLQRGRLCVGIDPHPHLIEQWGLDYNVDGLRTFSRICVEAFADTAALVKPQVAFFERFGSQGFAVLEETLSALRQAQCLTVADAKRGDIGSTMAGYAQAWLGQSSPLRADAVTVSPYLGVGALEPVFAAAETSQRGVFVLAATSNPEAAVLQETRMADGRTISQAVVDDCAVRNQAHVERGGIGNVGVVIGATLKTPPQLTSLGGPVLLPGVGAQGASAEDVNAIVSATHELGFANVSRSILSRGPKVSGLQEALRITAADFGG